MEAESISPMKVLRETIMGTLDTTQVNSRYQDIQLTRREYLRLFGQGFLQAAGIIFLAPLLARCGGQKTPHTVELNETPAPALTKTPYPLPPEAALINESPTHWQAMAIVLSGYTTVESREKAIDPQVLGPVVERIFKSCPVENCISTEGLTAQDYTRIAQDLMAVYYEINGMDPSTSHPNPIKVEKEKGENPILDTEITFFELAVLAANEVPPMEAQAATFREAMPSVAEKYREVWIEDANRWKGTNPGKLPEEWLRILPIRAYPTPGFELERGYPYNKAILLRVMRLAAHITQQHGLRDTDLGNVPFVSYKALERGGYDDQMDLRDCIFTLLRDTGDVQP
jgi:hypothetical protein